MLRNQSRLSGLRAVKALDSRAQHLPVLLVTKPTGDVNDSAWVDA
jgi:hypothetical protein